MSGQRQERTGSTATPTEARDIQSADSHYQVAETARLQAEAQARIDAKRNPNEIGSTP